MTNLTPVQPIHVGADQMAVKRQADAVARILDATGDPSLPPHLADALAAQAMIDTMRKQTLSMGEVAATLAAAGPKKLNLAMASAVEKVRNQQAMDALLKSLTSAYMAGAVREALDADHEAIATRLSYAFRKAKGDLIDAAKDLPGKDPLADAEAVLAAGAGDAWTVARTACEMLLSISSAFDNGTLYQRAGNAPPQVAPLAPIVAVADIKAEVIETFAHNPVDDMETRRPTLAVRAYADALLDHGPAVAVLKIARGDFAGAVTLDLATDPAEVLQRIRRLNTAFTREFQRDGSGIRMLR